MKSPNWKRTVGLGLSVFVLLVGSVGLTGCETEEGADQQEAPSEQDD